MPKRSIGHILKRTRERKKIPLVEVSAKTRIPVEYLTALEKNDYGKFSGKVHATGFLKIYSKFLGLNVDELLALWRREYLPLFERDVPSNSLFGFIQFKSPKVLVTPMKLFVGILGMSLLLFFSYLFYQYRNYVDIPRLDIYTPRDQLVTQKGIVDVTGMVDIGSKVYINGKQITLAPDGSFVIPIKLKEGVNVFSIRAVTPSDRYTEVVRTIIYRPPSDQNDVKDSN